MKRWKMPTLIVVIGLMLGLGSVGIAGEMGAANVIDVTVTRSGDGTFRFDVTIESNETGWDAYADAFEIVTPDGRVLGTRVLHHPHVDEQPFTRSLSGVDVPASLDRVTVRAHHNAAGYDGRTMEVVLPR